MDDSQAYEAAKSRVEAKMGFYTHIAVYAAVITFLAVIDLGTSAQSIWFHWPLIGWGVAVAIHAIFVFVVPNQFGVTEARIEDEMRRQQAKR